MNPVSDRKNLRSFASSAGAIGLMLLSAVSGSASAAPVTFNTALPVAEGQGLFREQLVAIERSDDPTPADRDLTVLGGVSVLGYGVTEDFAVFGALPFLDKALELSMPGGRVERSTSGFGDLRLFGRYTLFREDAPGRTFRIAPFAGVEAPTGATDESDALGRLPQPLQLGSGSWDPFFGVVGTWQTLDYQVDAQVGYEVNMEGANDFEFGDEFRADASFQYRLLPRELGPGVPGFLYGIIEANLLHQAENEISGADDPDSGGTTLFLSPGLQYVTKRWIVEGVVQVPVFQDLNGDALEDDWTVRAGFRFWF